MLGQRSIAVSGAVAAFVDRDALVKPYLGISGASEDALLTMWIAAAQDQIERYCDRVIATRTIVETIHDVQPSRGLVLAHSPVITLTSIVDGDGVTVVNTTYNLNAAAGLVHLKSPGAEWSGDLVVSYTAGYAAIPDAIKLATLELVKQSRNDKDRNQDAVIEQSTDTGMVTYKGAVPGVQQAEKAMPAMPDIVVRYLKPYRRKWA